MAEANFSRNLKVGFRDRGHGSVDFGIVNDAGHLIAEIKGVHFEDNEVPPKKPFVLLPHRENAYLFAGAPGLYDACVAALAHIKASNGDSALIAQLEAALKTSLVPTP